MHADVLSRVADNLNPDPTPEKNPDPTDKENRIRPLNDQYQYVYLSYISCMNSFGMFQPLVNSGRE